MTDSVISLPELDSAAKSGESRTLTLRIERDLCYETAHEVVSAVQYLLARSPREIVVEIGKVNSVDSSGLRALLAGAGLCQAAGVGFRLDKISDCVVRIVEMSWLSHLLGLPGRDVLSDIRRPGVHLGDAVWRTSEHVATSSASLIAVLREKIATAAEEVGATGELLCDIKIAVGEALTNAYRHGSPTKGTNRIQVKCMTCSSAFVVEIEDEGNPFNPGDTPDPQPGADHGMGLYLMRQAMDVVEFSFNHPGNRVRMVKWLRGD